VYSKTPYDVKIQNVPKRCRNPLSGKKLPHNLSHNPKWSFENSMQWQSKKSEAGVFNVYIYMFMYVHMHTSIHMHL